nr:hypothetical protein OH820_26000 [Streptomyces sp. NBC_00857]
MAAHRAAVRLHLALGLVEVTPGEGQFGAAYGDEAARLAGLRAVP